MSTSNVAPRYTAGTDASKALRQALRTRVVQALYGKTSGYKNLTGKQRQIVDARSNQRYQNMQSKQPGLEQLNPALRQLFLANQKRISGPVKSPKPPVSNNPQPGGGGNAPNPNVPNEYIQINSNGQLDLPYNQQFAGYLLDAKDAMNQRLLQLQQSQQAQQLDYARTMRDADLDYGNLARQTLNYNAGRGTAFSSALTKDIGENATEYANYTGDLNNANTLFQQGTEAERGAIEVGFNDMIRRWALAQAEKEAQNAGGLGYGKPTKHKGPGKVPGKPRKPQPKKRDMSKPPAKRPPKGKKWVRVKNKKGKTVRWKIVPIKSGGK